MKNVRYVILRKPPGTLTFRSAMPRAEAAGLATAPPRVEVDELPPQRAANLARKNDVEAMAPVVPMRLIAPVATGTPAQPLAGNTAWGVQAVAADRSALTGNGVVVAVLDTGIDPNHPAFAGMELVRGNFTSEGDDDTHGHGTHCAGTIFGRDVGGTRIGVARGVRKAIIGKVLGQGGGGSDMIVQAIQWAVANGAHVISMSLGIDFPGLVARLEADGIPTDLATSMALEGYRANIMLFEKLAAFIATQDTFMQATLLVAAAGNESRRELHPDYQIAVSPPAVADGFISVAAVGKSAEGFTVATFSNVGARVAGPGVDITSARPGGGLASMSGTSMATPHVAGVAALWAEKLAGAGALKAKHLADRLTGTASTAGMGPGVDYGDVGAGMVQAPAN